MSDTDQLNDFPRRNQLHSMTEAETAIFDAQQAVEHAGASPLLTEAGLLLQRARTLVSDHVDAEEKPWLDDSTADNYA